MRDLAPRQQSILRAVVIEYVTSAEPVGSEALVSKYQLGVKAATVRNELAELSDVGLLEKPHASAGRIPSDLGYRFFVDRLVVLPETDVSEKALVRDAAAEGEVLRVVLQETTRVLSRLTHLLAVATTVKEAGVQVKNAILSVLGPNRALFVMILSNGHVENRLLETTLGLTLEEVGSVNEQLTAALTGKTLRSLTRSKAPQIGSQAVDAMLVNLWGHAKSIAKDLTQGVTVSEGEEFMFAQPEFAREASRLSELLHELVGSNLLHDALVPCESVKPITIGREHRDDRLHELSVVRRSFYVGDSEAGIIAIVGPTRMRYAHNLSLVNFTAEALSDSLTRLFA